MPGLGLKNFGSEVLTSNDVDGYLMQQAVMVFASSAARTTAFTSASLSPSEGMISYLQDTNELFVYNGSTWIQISNATVEASNSNASGVTTRPFTPMFKAHSAGQSISNSGTWPLATTSLNVGSCWNTSTQRFTAPVAGNYFFGGMIRVDSNQSYVHLQPYVNGAPAAQSGELPALGTTGTASGFTSESFAFSRYLAANDTFFFIVNWLSGGPFTINTQSHMFGFLIG